MQEALYKWHSVTCLPLAFSLFCITTAGLAQSVERLTAEQQVAGLIRGAGPILRVLK